MLSHIYTPKKDDTPITPSVLPTLPRAFVPIHPTWRTRFCSQGLGEDLVDKNGTSNFFNRKCGHLSLSLWRAWIQSIFWVTMFIPLTCSKTCLLSKVMDNFWFQVEHGMPPKGSFPLRKGHVPLNHDLMGARTNQMLQVLLAVSEPSQNCTPKSIKCELWIKRANCSTMGGYCYVSTQKSDTILQLASMLATKWKNRTCD